VQVVAAPVVYTYEIRDLATNILLETVPLQDASFSKVLNDTSSCTATLPVPLYNSLGQLRETYELTTPAHTCLYVYRDTRPVWGGVIWTSVYDSKQSTIKLGAADWWSLLDHRKILPVLSESAFTDTAVVAGLKTTYTQQDQNEIARQLLAQAQAHAGGNFGIVASTSNSGFLRDRTYPGFSMTSLGDALRNLSQVIDGPDIRFDVGAAGADGKPVRLMLIGTPRLGQVGSEHVWELGGNITSYTWPRDGTRMRTRSFAIGEGSDEGTPIGVAEDSSLYANGWPLLEDDTSYDRTSGDTSTLINHAIADQETTGLPVVLPMLTVRGDVAPTVADLSPGDDGRVIINDPFHGYGPPQGNRGLDTYMRLVRMDVSPNEAGEVATLTMAPMLEDLA
jgi:hypothetical protein